MLRLSTVSGKLYKTGSNKFSSPKTTAVFCKSGFFDWISSIRLPTILVCPTVFGVPII